MSSESGSSSISQSSAKAALRLLADAHYALLDAHLAAASVNTESREYETVKRALNALALVLAEGKWHLSVATGECADFAVPTRSPADLELAVTCLRECANHSRDLIGWLSATRPEPGLDHIWSRLSKDREIHRIGSAPVVPSICPIVVLMGSWRDMGAQYVQQCVDIFGDFVFRRAALRQFDQAAQGEISAWARELATHAPSVHEFAIGMAVGSQSTDSPMTTEQAMALWTGWGQPLKTLEELGVKDSITATIMSYFGALREPTTFPDSHDLCSGFAAWGSASLDGALIAGSTTDHDATFQATIVAYPIAGAPFIYTPFSVNGSIPGVGYFQFAGLPGINRDGLCYVHHGGAIGAGAEPPSSWGYGLRRGASTVALLATCSTTDNALSRELAWPVGDAASILGAPGGFYADRRGGYVLEARRTSASCGSPIARRSTLGPDGTAHSFLYANNNCLDPRSGHQFCPPEHGYQFEAGAGWFTLSDAECRDASPAVAGRRMWTKSSESRNRYLYGELLKRAGSMSIRAARDIYARGPQFKFDRWTDFERRWAAGERFDGSTAHRGNAFTALVRASDAGDPEYWACMGNAAGAWVTPNRTGHGYFYFDETYTFWRIVLKATPQQMVDEAREEAIRLIDAARGALGLPNARPYHTEWFTEAQLQLAHGGNSQWNADSSLQSDQTTSEISRCLRSLTRAQVRARQILRALAPHAEMSV